ncbi:MAG: tyrosine-type recombinase/integrase [Chloroflexota bacterium]
MSSPIHPELYTPIRFWSSANSGAYSVFQEWPKAAGYSHSTLSSYSCAVRLAISQLNKPYWQISDADLDHVRAIIARNYSSKATQQLYYKGLLKWAEWLDARQGKPKPERQTNWAYFLAGLPDEVSQAVRDYVRHAQRNWGAEQKRDRTDNRLCTLTQCLRWAVKHWAIAKVTDLTPEVWFAYVDARLEDGINPKTLNRELHALQGWLRVMKEQDIPICDRMLKVKWFKSGRDLPKDVPLAQLKRVAAEIEQDAVHPWQGVRRCGVMDRAWWRLMLMSGLRVGEVRRLRQADLDLPNQRLRIVQSKGLKDQIVFLSTETVSAIEAYLPLRGPVLDDHLFVYRHRPLTPTYCAERLRTYGKRCGVQIRPHKLRHSCATLLLNAGAPELTVQALLGHKNIDTTLGYARLYDRTVAADYYRAMTGIEHNLQTTPTTAPTLPPAQMVALVDALSDGTLNDQQREFVHILRSSLEQLAEQGDRATVAADGLLS